MRKYPALKPKPESASTAVGVPVAGIVSGFVTTPPLPPPWILEGVGVAPFVWIVIAFERLPLFGVGVGVTLVDREKKMLSKIPPKIGPSGLFLAAREKRTPSPIIMNSKIKNVNMTFRASPISCSIPHFFILDKLFPCSLYFEDMYSSLKKNITLASANTLLFLTAAVKAGFAADPSEVQINEVDLGFKIPNFSDLLSFLVRFFFVMAGLAALFYMLWGAFSWVISGGESEAVDKARGKITSAIVGMIVIVATLAIIWSLENIVFKKSICFGISCPVTLPNLLECVDDGTGRCD